MATFKARLPLFLFLGSVFLAMASVSVGLAYWEKENPKYEVCFKSCGLESDVSRHRACHARCRLINKKDPQQGRQREEEKQQEDPQEQRQHRQEREQEQQKERGDEQRSQEQRLKNQNPYHFSSDRFQTRFENENGRIRVLQRFDQRSDHLQGLRDYRVAEFELKPQSLFLPHHRDAEALIVALEGRAIVGIVNQNKRESFYLEQGDVLRVPAGTIAYTANIDENQNFRVANFLIPLNIPGQYENLYPSGNQVPQSYYNAFSKRTLEATFNTNYDEIKRVLFGEEEQQGKGKEEEQSSEEGVIVKLSKEQIRELSRHAKSSPRGGRSSRSGPFNLRNLQPRYSNNYGNLLEARPQDFELLRDLGISISFLDLNKRSLFLPHYNSRAILVAYVAGGKGQLELASPHLANRRSKEQGEESEQEEQQQQQQQQEEEDEEKESEGQIQSVSSKLSQGDVFVGLAGHPIALRASKKSNLKVVGFALNAEDNQRNFLGGERDNVINPIESIVKELAFAGSGQDVEKLFGNQKESYFVSAELQQSEERQGKRAPLSSILGPFF